jgi:hypothetical protein
MRAGPVLAETDAKESPMKASAIVLGILSLSLFGLSGCNGIGCGVGPVPSQNDGGATAHVDSSGHVVFSGLSVGESEVFAMPLMETADTDETIVSGTVSGAGAAAFQIVSTFPIQVADHQQVTLEVRFAPTMVGEADAELDLQTEKMGISHVDVEGTGM